ncbi:hypothetical protein [Beijerinckia indica]|uniref:Uncharacterized protein n=1 Tax=Beijerinckia indica subsp. indica (strain ATCC 9039 / DSM 1715 / NCIMB 8712) TaxID=395963 RepID=B2IIH5_BEII9|nr:hypothetical protein [Beijerinckia indica]ACB96128.1 conserved hypothetical protein [Beijerinckia indica subsp. indica ATCC 9039]
MKSFAMTILVGAALSMPLSASAETVTFGNGQPDALPKAFVSAMTGSGEPHRWDIVEDATAADGRALAQLNKDKTEGRFLLTTTLLADSGET